MDRILIFGLSGSGKSTFSNKLGKKLNREVVHLDKIYYPHPFRWEHTQSRDEWKQTVRDLVAQEKWIIDGHYNSTLDIRMPRADTIIFFNFNKILCLYRVVKRTLSRTQPFDKAEGNFNHISWNLIKKIIIFDRNKMLKMLEQYKDTKKIFVVKNKKEAENLLKTF